MFIRVSCYYCTSHRMGNVKLNLLKVFCVHILCKGDFKINPPPVFFTRLIFVFAINTPVRGNTLFLCSNLLTVTRLKLILKN